MLLSACFSKTHLDEELADDNKMVEQFEVANQITGEIIVCGWHVNTYQVGFRSHDLWLP